jgi:arginase
LDTTILTPYFLDHHYVEDVYGLRALADREVEPDLLTGGDKQTRMSTIYASLATEVAEVLGDGGRPISFAGDCCASIGVLAGLRRAGLEPTLLWFDAHGDYNTWDTTPSGFLGGMPLAMAVGRGEQTLLDRTGMRPWPEGKVILTDGRDLDPGERDLVNASAIHHLTDMRALLQPGVIPDGPLYVHFDTDIIDPSEAPAMNYPASGGPSAADVQAVFRSLAKTGRVVAMSVSLWEPTLDSDGRTRAVTLETLSALLDDPAN